MDFNVGPVNTKGTGRFGSENQYGLAWTSPPTTAGADLKVEFNDLMQFKTSLETCIKLNISGTAHGCVEMFHQQTCVPVPAKTLRKFIPDDPMCLNVDFELVDK